MKTRSASGKLKSVNYVEEHDNEADSEQDNEVSIAVDEDRDESESEHYKPTKKKRRTSHNPSSTSTPDRSAVTKKVNGKDVLYRGRNVGKLSKLLEMPVDIFCEIGKHLDPLDILHLARSTKGFNAMLMSKDSKPIWRTARRSLPGLPDCPPDLSEPQYARLLFERDCHACLSPRAMKVDWVTRSRLCHRCRSSYILKGTTLLKSVPELTEDLLEYIPCRYQGNLYRKCTRRLEYFYVTRVEVMVKRYLRTPVQERAEFLKYHKELMDVILKHASEVHEWLLLDRVNKSREASDIINRRKLEILARLTELGYTDYDFPWNTEDPEWSNIMYQPRDLTPRIWKAARPRLEAIIAKVKKQREERDKRIRKNLRRSELSPYLAGMLDERYKEDPRLYVPMENAFEIPAVDAILSEDDCRVQITAERWKAVKDRVERELDEYADQRAKQLAQLISKASHKGDGPSSTEENPFNVDAAVDCLKSPSAFFACTICSGIFRYPDLFTHFHGWVSKWDIRSLTFYDPSVAICLSKSLGGDQQVASAMAAGDSFQCLRCDKRISPPRAWEELVRHFVSEQKWHNTIKHFISEQKWQNSVIENIHGIDETEGRPMVAILSAEEASQQQEKVDDFAEGPREYRCKLCHRLPLTPSRGILKTRPEIELHLQAIHEISTPTKEHIMGPGL